MRLRQRAANAATRRSPAGPRRGDTGTGRRNRRKTPATSQRRRDQKNNSDENRDGTPPAAAPAIRPATRPEIGGTRAASLQRRDQIDGGDDTATMPAARAEISETSEASRQRRPIQRHFTPATQQRSAEPAKPHTSETTSDAHQRPTRATQPRQRPPRKGTSALPPNSPRRRTRLRNRTRTRRERQRRALLCARWRPTAPMSAFSAAGGWVLPPPSPLRRLAARSSRRRPLGRRPARLPAAWAGDGMMSDAGNRTPRPRRQPAAPPGRNHQRNRRDRTASQPPPYFPVTHVRRPPAGVYPRKAGCRLRGHGRRPATGDATPTACDRRNQTGRRAGPRTKPATGPGRWTRYLPASAPPRSPLPRCVSVGLLRGGPG